MDEIKLLSHWKKVCFGEICTLRKESFQPKNQVDIAYVGLEHIDSGSPNLTRQGTASEVKSSKSKFYPGDVLYGKLRPYLDKAILANFEGICSTDILVFSANELVKPDFLIYLVHTKDFINHAIKTTRGVNHPRTSWTSLSQFNFNLPPLPEQKSIAYTLRTIQKAKETRQRELELEWERKAALMEYLFTHGTRNEARKQTKIGKIPESWEVVKLGDISKINSGGTPSRNKPEYWNGDIPWVKTGEINYGIITDTEEKITKEGLENSSAKIIPCGTILMAMYGQGITRGKVAILGINATINQACAAILLQNDIFVEYVFYFLSWNYERIRLLGYGANQTNLNSMIIKSMDIPLPIYEEQKEIANILKSCDTKIQALEKEISLTDELFHATLEELMTGKLSTKNLIEQ